MVQCSAETEGGDIRKTSLDLGVLYVLEVFFDEYKHNEERKPLWHSENIYSFKRTESQQVVWMVLGSPIMGSIS